MASKKYSVVDENGLNTLVKVISNSISSIFLDSKKYIDYRVEVLEKENKALQERIDSLEKLVSQINSSNLTN